MMRHSTRILIGISCFAILLTASVHATVTNIVFYRLGENDTSATIGGLTTNTVDAVGAINLRLTNGPHYSADISAGAAHAGSSVSMQFSSGQWGTNAVIPSIVNNFGMECWVKPSATNGIDQIIAYNGDTAFSGWGLLIGASGAYQFLFGGAVISGTNAATPNVWTHLAAVRDSGQTTLYVNGVPTVTSLVGPGVPTKGFAIGAPPNNPTSQFFSGLLDEVRVFTFAPGQFSTNDLLLNQLTNHSFVVTTLADSGPGSLRTLINNAYDGDVITFATNGTLTLTGGELPITKSISINGPGAINLSISGNHSSRVFNIANPSASVTIAFLKIRDAFGSAVYNSGNLLLNFCTLTGNSTPNGGNGGYSAGGGAGGSGGALNNIGSVVLNSCTLYNNQTGNGGNGGDGFFTGFTYDPPGAGGNGGSGGAIYNSGFAKLVQCTISGNFTGHGGVGGSDNIGNTAGHGGGGNGGGIYNVGIMSVIASTIASNGVAASGPGPNGNGGGIFHSDSAPPLSMINTILAGNSGNCPDVFGTYNSLGHNFISQSDGSIGFTNAVNGNLVGSTAQPLDPKLAPLDDYGGQTSLRTLTFALLPGSGAIDSGDDAVLSPPYSLIGDQLNRPRKFGTHVDMGAFELQLVFSNTTVTTLPIAPIQDPIFGGWTATLQGIVNPGGYPTALYFQYGITPAYGGVAPAGNLPTLDATNSPVSAALTNLVDSRTYHYRLVATNAAGIFVGGDQTFSTALVPPVLGDLDGDGFVDGSELSLVQSNYFRNSPWLLMTNVAGLGGTNVTFALSNSTVGNISVEYTTNLTNWQLLGPAIPRYLFTDTNAPVGPQRYYRLRWP